MSNASPTLAVLFYRIGPYHYARLKAAGSRLQVTGVEFSTVDPTYAWDLVEGADGFNRVTLFSGVAVNELPASRIFSRVGQVLDQLRPQVVAIPGWYDRCSLAALRWCGSHGVPAVVMSETTAWDVERKWLKEALKRRLIKLCAAGLVGGRAHADYLKQLGIERTKIFFGYDAVDNEYFQTKADEIRKQSGEVTSPLEYGKDSTGHGNFTGQGSQKSEMGLQDYETTRPQDRRSVVSSQSSVVRGRYGLPEKYFLASARFVEKKNLPRLLQAYARYRQLAAAADNRQQTTDNGPSVVGSPSPVVSGPVVPWSLVLLGDGPLRSTLNSQLLARDLSESTLNLHGHVQMPGFKQYPDLPAYYGLAKAFIHASTTEQWGLVVNEAMASGLPVLVSNRCGCAMNLVKDGVNGFTFDPFNVEEMAEVMLRLTETPKHRLTEMGDASREIISNWGPERFAKGLHDAVETALKNPRPRARLLDHLLLKALIYK